MTKPKQNQNKTQARLAKPLPKDLPREIIHTHLIIFGIIPAWRHSLLFHKISEPLMTIFSQQQGGLIKKWDHAIKFEVKPESVNL
jgi:hypothetical protein